MACKRHTVSVTQPKVGVVYESNFLKNPEENVILCLFWMEFTTASVFTSWGRPGLAVNAPSNNLPRAVPAFPDSCLISWQWQGCQMQEAGRALHPERERPHLQGRFEKLKLCLGKHHCDSESLFTGKQVSLTPWLSSTHAVLVWWTRHRGQAHLENVRGGWPCV